MLPASPLFATFKEPKAGLYVHDTIFLWHIVTQSLNMKRFVQKIRRAYIFFAFLLTGYLGSAQESMMPDVSPVFLSKLIDTAYKYYPRVRTFDHRWAIANENLKKAKLSWFDPFTFSYVYSPNNSSTIVNPSVLNGYQFGIFFNISSLLNKPATIRAAKEEMVITKLEKDAYLTNLVAEIKARYYRYVATVALLKMRSQAAVEAETLMKQSRYKFEKSEETFESYNRISTAFNDRKQTVIQSEAEMLIAKSYLEEMVGKKLEEIN